MLRQSGVRPTVYAAPASAAADAPAVLVACPPLTWADGPDRASAVHRTVGWALRLVQDWIAEERLAGSRLVVLTSGAVATGAEPGGIGDDDAAPVHAPVCGGCSVRCRPRTRAASR
ncbi:hypothetical protein [Streptomyces sp. L-9-10]|uniref:hypothetical protein n=1 Tax=Streptomyces sp. L-9-10 TaxID=1478131 RepID=UPI00101E1B09|nr:hypothetical protein [Streptomyces sp. L-9-10]